MKQLTKYVLTLAALLAPILAFGQGQFTTIGTDFWLGFNSRGTYYELKFVSTSACTVTLTFTDGTVPDRTINIAAAGVTSYVFNHTTNDGYDEMAAVRNSTGISKKSLKITATAPIGIYAINQQSALTDATSVLPVTNYGTEHIMFDGITMTDHKYIVISPEDGNNIYINGGGAIALNKGEVYTKVSATELSGDIVTSDKPVAFFMVSHELRIPTSSISYTDQAFEQLPPVSSWGKEFLVPVTQRASEFVRVIASMDNTSVSFAGTSYTLNTGETLTGGLREINIPTYIIANKPIGVCTYMVGSSYKGNYGDPAISWVPSIDQYIKSATIAPFAPTAVPGTSTQLTAHWGQVVVKTAYKNDTKVNDEALSGGTWVDGPVESGLSVYNMPFLQASGGWEKSYTFTNNNGLVVLGYGTGSAESYQYLAASSSRKLDAYFTINNIHYEDANLQIPFNCGTPFNFKATIEYDLNLAATSGYIRWFVDGVEVTSAKNQTTWTMPYMSAGNHEVILQVTDEYNRVEEMRTTLAVECSIAISPTPVTINEGESVVITIALSSGITPVPITFNLSAASGSDADPLYYSFPSSITMPANASSVTFTVSTTINSLVEPDRLLAIKASTSSYSDSYANITIKDRTSGELIVKQLNDASEPSTNGKFWIGFKNENIKSTLPVAVNYTLTGTAVEGVDYEIPPTYKAAIPAGQNGVEVEIKTKNNFIVQGLRIVTITLDSID